MPLKCGTWALTLIQNGYTFAITLYQLRFVAPAGDANFTLYTITGGVPAITNALRALPAIYR